MKTNALIIVLTLLCFSINAQSDLSAEAIFEKVIQHYDPEGKWDQFKGAIHITSYGENWSSEEDLMIDNTADLYNIVLYMEEGTFAKRMQNDEILFEIGGKQMAASEVPEQYQKQPYDFTPQNVKRFNEHHTAHFSLPLMMKAAGAKPEPEVDTQEFFGANCLTLTFENGLPNSFEYGWYNGPFTLFVDAENDYRLQGAHIDNGLFGEGFYFLFQDEMEVNGIKMPSRKLAFRAKNMYLQMIDVFSTDTKLN